MNIAYRLFTGFFFVIIISISSSCYSSDLREDAKVSFIDDSGVESSKFLVHVARTPEELSRGLMYRRNIPDYHGMFFVFEGMDHRSFWMKNTYLPLDMIFIDDKGVIKHILHEVPPLTKTSRKSKYPCKYVLELKGGMTKKAGIEVGSLLKIEPEDII